MDLCVVDRCLVVAGVMLPFALGFWAVGAYSLRHPALVPYYDFAFLRGFQRALLVFIGAWVALVGVCLALRSRHPGARAVMHVTIQLYSIGNAVGAFAVGPMTTPHVVVLVGGAAVGLFLFDTRAVTLGIASAGATLAAGGLAVHRGLIPYAPMLAAPPYVDGQLSSFWLGQMALIGGSVGLVVLLLFAYLVTRLHDREARLVYLSQTDGLTGIANRRHFIERFGEEFARAERYRTPLAVVILDLDHFKRVNDQHGHLAGDRVIVGAAGALTHILRQHDSLARWGGEEFVMLLPQTDLHGAEAVAERCRAAVEEMVIDVAGTALQVTVSIGVACHPHPRAARSEDLLQRADDALYRAKHAGRNRVASMPPPAEINGAR
jgi:diguanylate cyclase (GGDEF)-like protein